MPWPSSTWAAADSAVRQRRKTLGDTTIKRLRRGFTLVELLVVISIIALLVAILLPVLHKARFQAKNLLCGQNMNQQAKIQLIYAADNDGQFAPHDSWADPLYMASAGDENNLVWDVMYPNYLDNGKILMCPVLERKQGSLFFKDSDYLSPSGYGGWDSDTDPGTPGLQRPPYLMTMYNWYANFLLSGQEMLYHPYGEPPWPRNLGECKSAAAFISHYMVGSDPNPNVRGDETNGDWGWVHGDDPYNDFGAKNPDTNPVAYSDGHVENHANTEIRMRAYAPGAGWGYLY